MQRNRFSPQRPHRISRPIIPGGSLSDGGLLSILGIAAVVLLVLPNLARAQWTKVNNAPNASSCLLLTDGSVMCQSGEQTKSWQRLTPDQNGKYATGKWTALTDLPQPNPNPPGYGPLYYASAVIKDGRVFVIGGEYNNGYTGCKNPPAKNCPTALGYVFDPTANGGAGKWSGPITVPAGYSGSDNQGVILADGTILIADINTGNIYQLDPVGLTLTLVNATGKLDINDEEGWTLLPNGKVLTVDANNTANLSTGGGTAYELYDPTTIPTSWTSPGYTPVNLADLTSAGQGSHEVGPAVLRPDGTVVYFGGNPSGRNATYNWSTDTWQTAETFPTDPKNGNKQLTVADGPASILPDGNVLVEAAPGVVNGAFGTGSHFFEFDTNGVLTDVTGNNGPNVGGEASYHGRMLVLPTGETLYTHGSNDVFLYTNTGTPQNMWRPVITSPPPSVIGPGDSYPIAGMLFNGLSGGAAYGDNAQMASNYPLVRVTNLGSGHVFYARTHDHSSMGVQAVNDSSIRSTTFDVPGNLELGASTLEVVTNGIPSVELNLNVEPATSLVFTGVSATTSDFNDPAQVQARLTSGGSSVAGKTVVFTLGSGIGVPTCSGVTDGTGTATCSLTPNQPAGTYTLTATFLSDSSFAGSSASVLFVVKLEDTAVAYTGPTSGDYHDATTVKAVLTDPTDGVPIQGKTVEFVLGSGTGTETCQAMTGPSGLAMCQITPNQQAGPYTLITTFAGNAFYAGSSKLTTFTITREETTLSYTGDVVFTDGLQANLSGVLLEDNLIPIVGRSVKFVLGSGATAQTCTATTNALGVAACTIHPVAQPRGSGVVGDLFAGDAFYLPSNASVTTLIYGFPDAVRLSNYPSPSTVGQTVRLIAVVVPGPGLPDPPLPSTPTGTVTFYDVSIPLGTVALDATAQATLNVSFSSKGKHFITARYSGDAIFIPSSATVIQNVQ